MSSIVILTFLKASVEPIVQSRFFRLGEYKLEHTKRILEGLAMNDYQRIAVETQALKALSLQSSWNAHTTADYLDHSADFRRP